MKNRIQLRHAVLLIVIAVLLCLCALKFAERQEHLRKYETMAETAVPTVAASPEPKESTAEPEVGTEPETEPTEAPDPDLERVIDFAQLKDRNGDVVAWLYVPDTVINYPVLYKENDNEYYLHRDIDLNEGSYEGIYLDGADAPDLSMAQNLFYGHHMKNGTMFTAVCDFKEEKFFKAHDRLYLYTPDHTYVLKPLACLYTGSGPEKRRVTFTDRDEFDAYVDEMTRECSYREIPEGGVDRIFSLVTCSYEFNDARTILYAYEVGPDGKPVRDQKLWN